MKDSNVDKLGKNEKEKTSNTLEIDSCKISKKGDANSYLESVS